MLLATLLGPLGTLSLPVLAIVLMALLLGCCEIGFRLGRWRARHGAARGEGSNIGTVTAGMLGLLAFTLGLAISIAQGRFDARRTLVLSEANAIGTAWLRAGLTEGPEGPEIRRLLADWTRARIEYTSIAPDGPAVAAVNARTNALQNAIWQRMEALARRQPNPVTTSLATALNEVFDMAMAQRFAYESRVPAEILWMLLAGSVLAISALGYQLGIGAHRFPLLSTLLIGMWVGGMLLIIDLSRPREGQIRADPAPLVWTLEGFGATAR